MPSPNCIHSGPSVNKSPEERSPVVGKLTSRIDTCSAALPPIYTGKRPHQRLVRTSSNGLASVGTRLAVVRRRDH